ncbi:MAG: hypothetical protein Q8L47_00840 [bacterium]|nr:hypothetical protein [bacterium]
MKKNEIYDYICPHCKKIASVHRTLNKTYAAQSLRIPYFLCGECRLIYISRSLLKETVREWWIWNKKILGNSTLKYFYNESIKYLFGPVLKYHKGIGYREARFKKS